MIPDETETSTGGEDCLSGLACVACLSLTQSPQFGFLAAYIPLYRIYNHTHTPTHARTHARTRVSLRAELLLEKNKCKCLELL